MNLFAGAFNQARQQLSQATFATTDVKRAKKLLKTEKKLQALLNKLSGNRAIRTVDPDCLAFLRNVVGVLLEIVQQLP